jgi:hypothetical protein
MNSKGFAKELQRFIDQDVRGRTLTLYRKICFDLGRSVVLGTPVLTGLARASWRFTTSRVSQAYNPNARDPTGAKALGRLNTAVGNLTLQKRFYLTNNAPYIEKLEHGYSKQAPAGMLAKNIARVQAKYRVL